MKVLVVDDVGFVRHYLDRLISSRGHTVLTAESGRQALKLLTQDMMIQAVVTDLIMPGIDGIELFSESRKIDRFDDRGPLPPPEFILITAVRPSASAPQKDMARLQQAVDLGFADVMLKPIDNEVLLKKLAEIEEASGKPPTVAPSPPNSAPSAPSEDSSPTETPEDDFPSEDELLERIDLFEKKQLALEEQLVRLDERHRELTSMVQSGATVATR